MRRRRAVLSWNGCDSLTIRVALRGMLMRRTAMPGNGRTWRIALVLCALAALLLSSCGTPDRPAQQSAAPAAVPAAAPAAAAPTTAALNIAKPVSDQLYIREVSGENTEHLTIIDSVSGSRERELPGGTVAPDWSALYTTKDNFT